MVIENQVFGEHQETYPAHLPWVYRDPCSECAESKKGACQRHWAIVPKLIIRQDFPRETVLPCVGLWDEHDQEEVTPEVKLRCAGCPARTWCLQTAVANNEHGIWAATTAEERAAMRTTTQRKEAA